MPLDYDNEAILAGFNLVGNPFVEEATFGRTYYKMNNDGSDVEKDHYKMKRKRERKKTNEEKHLQIWLR